MTMKLPNLWCSIKKEQWLTAIKETGSVLKRQLIVLATKLSDRKGIGATLKDQNRPDQVTMDYIALKPC